MKNCSQLDVWYAAPVFPVTAIHPCSLIFLTAFIAVSSSAWGAVVTQTTSQGAIASGWDQTTIWSVDAVPSVGNTYINPATRVLRTPEANNAVFGGDTLTIRGTLALKSSGGTSRTKSANVILDGGTISNYTDGNDRIQTLAGTMDVIATSTISAGGGGQNRHNQFSALISGSASINFTSANATSANIFTNSSNSFSGTWNLQSGILRFANGGAVGSGLISMSGGTLEIESSWTGNGLSLTGGSVALADHQWTVQSLTVGSTSFGQGTYDLAALNGIGGVTFTGNAGTITVIPEASVVMSAVAGALPLLLRRRRSC